MGTCRCIRQGLIGLPGHDSSNLCRASLCTPLSTAPTSYWTLFFEPIFVDLSTSDTYRPATHRSFVTGVIDWHASLQSAGGRDGPEGGAQFVVGGSATAEE